MSTGSRAKFGRCKTRQGPVTNGDRPLTSDYLAVDRKHRFSVKNSEHETMTKIKNVRMTKTWSFQRVCFDHFVIG